MEQQETLFEQSCLQMKCRECGETKPVSEFDKQAQKWCKVCRRAWSRRKYHADPVRSREMQTVLRRSYMARNWARYRYPILVAAARKRNIAVSFTTEEFQAWFRAQEPIACRYCKLTRAELDEMGISISLDRLENDGPYSLENIAIACLCCNKVKLDVLTDEDMIIVGPVVRARLLARKAAGHAKLGSQTSGPTEETMLLRSGKGYHSPYETPALRI